MTASKIKNELNGALIVDKPAGMTSHDVVSRLRRILRTKKIGHTGTLDPFATGVLVMLVGKATRLSRFLDKDQKTYEAVVNFGFETDTGDRDGAPKSIEVEKSIPSIEELAQLVNSVIPEFTGEIMQVPPMYSAKKVKGKKLYELARQGIEIEREPVSVKITRLNVLDTYTQNDRSNSQTPNEITITVASSAGTYIRTLAEDIGRRIGIPCHLSELRRTHAGGYDLAQSVTLEELEELANHDAVDTKLIRMSEIAVHISAQSITKDEEELIGRGIKIEARIDTENVQEVRLINDEKELIAIGETDGVGKIQPRLVFKN